MTSRAGGFALTGSGLTAVLGGAVLLALGLVGGYPTLVALGLGALAAAAIGLGHVARRPGLTAARGVDDDRVTAGGQARGRITVANPVRRPAPGFDVVDNVGGVPVRVAVPPLPAGGETVLDYPIPADRRGLLPLGPVRVERHDPWRLARRWAPLTGASLLWVHPRSHPTRPLPVGLALDFDGRHAERAGSTAFSSLREYQPGDDPRSVHWRSTARLGTLVVRDRVDTREPSVHIVIDASTTAIGVDAFEEAVSLAASICTAYQRAGRPVGLSAVGEDHAAVSAAGGHSVLDRLAALQRAQADPTALTRLIGRAPAGGGLVVITGGQPEVTDAVAACHRRFWTTVVARIGPALPDGLHHRSGIAVLTTATAEHGARLFTQLSGAA
ncbi:uncharacterized protein (DUF58 family) [Allocatelliglobosispora scoriae]|uniref:Uncharacterized protein (DUF58 family) n=1 Tax=Allocatelliglobosispora scoriae TaxID=643052 RepID=A0A841BK32_9ACTN|nr:DUF58 domain-containing protein [Allocatelliglobosispora scoriae]MBB5867373.1 uncharacterized protein (DUF58 family) [Allocatelliglobosispora scoriae]